MNGIVGNVAKILTKVMKAKNELHNRVAWNSGLSKKVQAVNSVINAQDSAS